MRKILIGVVVALVVVVAAVLGAVAYLRTAGPDYDRDATVVGLSAPVEILRDSLGVPYVIAQDEADLYFAVGYLHAQDRLWQMELFRRVAEGRLAEVLGEELVETDAFLRTIGLWRAAGAAVDALPDDERWIIEAYTAGVNAWVENRRGALPPEFVALRIEPEPWTPRHTLAVEKIMAWDLAAYEEGLELARAVRILGPERARHLVPDAPAWGATILDAPLPPPIPVPAAALLGALSTSRASNSWVISGEHTASGKPILANDMHLEMRAPSIWYLVGLKGEGTGKGKGEDELGGAGRGADARGAEARGAEAGGVEAGGVEAGGEVAVVGMSLPGAPFVVAGHTRAIAWGLTNAYLDDVDFFVERLDPADTTRYLTPEGSEPFEVVHEAIRVRNRAEPVVVPVRWTRHGPILTPVEPRAGGELIAMRWIAHEPARTWSALRKLSRAEGWDDFVDAIADFQNPHQNVIYADTAGRIGYWMSGRVPIRGGGHNPPLLPVPGWTGEWDWNGYLPFEAHPHIVDPREGFIVTANNRQAAGSVGDRVGSRWAEPFRAMRIVELIREGIRDGIRFDTDAVLRQQLDLHDGKAERYIDRAIGAARRAGLGEAAELLEGWDFVADVDSRAAAFYYVWQERLRAGATRSIYGGASGWFPSDALTNVLERRALPWVERGGEEAFEALAERAAIEADSIVDGRAWGELQTLRIGHALGGVEILERALGLDLGPVPLGGSDQTVNVAHAEGGAFPVAVRWGVSQRHVVDMGDVDGAGGFIIPTGQSGLPFSPHYKDQFERWLGGELWRIPLDRARASEGAVARMILRPEPQT